MDKMLDFLDKKNIIELTLVWYYILQWTIPKDKDTPTPMEELNYIHSGNIGQI